MAKEVGRKVQTVYTKENYQEFNRVHYHKTLGKKKYWFLLFVILTLPLIFFYMFNGTSASIWMITFFGILDIFILIEVWSNILPDNHTKQNIKRDPAILNLVNVFEFFPDHFTIKNSYATSTVDYNKLHHVVETEEFFYLYHNKLSAFLVEKEQMKEKDVEFLQTTLKEEIKKKYYQINKRSKRKTKSE